MNQTISIYKLKTFIEKKLKKKLLLKIIWNDGEKITLFITPNLKINSFIHDESEGYLFFDNEGKQINQPLPCVLSEEMMKDGEVIVNESLKIGGKSLSKEDKKRLIEN